jgi:uncharacterized membrane protein YoaK (UPF0700 family)
VNGRMAMSSSPDPVPPSILVGITAATGIVDAVSFLALGHVFTANMTGNVVFLGFALAGAKDLSIARSFTALVAFMLGAVLGGRMATQLSSRAVHRWVGSALGVDASFLFAAAVASLGLAGSYDANGVALYAVTGLMAVGMGFRNASVRKLGMPDLTTTVLTQTIAGLAADSSLAGGSNPRWQRRCASLLAMFAGAIIGGLMLRHSVAVPLGVCGVTSLASSFAVFAYAGRRRDVTAGSQKSKGSSI